MIVDGKKIASDIYDTLRESFRRVHKTPELHILYVGNDPVIDNFIRFKEQAGKSLGVAVHIHRFSHEISEEELIGALQKIQQSASGIVVQLPLPQHIHQEKILSMVPAELDIDVLGKNAQQQFIQRTSRFVPPVAGALEHIARTYACDFSNKKILLVGNGILVGYPVSLWLDRQQYVYDVIDKETPNHIQTALFAQADIIISGAGQPEFIHASMIRDGVALFDCGTSELSKKITGDIHPSSYEKASLVTPVPGGVGPLTIAVLYENLLIAHTQRYE